jgi:hypothetical protein
VTGVSPNIGQDAGGITVTITGTSFEEVSAVKFGGSNAASFKVLSETSIEAVSPEGTGTVDVTVTTPAGTSPMGTSDQFTYTGKARWFVNNVASLRTTAMVSWGTVSLRTVVGGSGEVVCHTLAGGTVTNPPGSAQGVGSILAFATYRCQSAACPGKVTLAAEGLPWSVHLATLGGVNRMRSEGVQLRVECNVEGKEPTSERFVGSYQPTLFNGVSATLPSFAEFDPESGNLEKEGSKGAVQEKLEGELKLLGYEAQEVVTGK